MDSTGKLRHCYATCWNEVMTEQDRQENSMSVQNTRPSSDVTTMMTFEANKKSTGLAYVLWFFLGGLGVHRFYIGRTGSGIAMLLILIVGWLTTVFVVGFALLVALGIWWIVDAFLLSGMVSAYNNSLASRLSNNAL